MSEEPKLDRKDLKIQALLEKIGRLESQEADYRVDITLLASENERLAKELKELKDVKEEK